MAQPVFISYSSQDRTVADRLCSVIESQNLRCWMAPRDILPGTDWAAQIIDGINSAAAMALVMSIDANRSPQILREVERAVHRQLPILPLRIDATPLSKSFEYFLSAHHWYDASAGSLESHFVSFARAVGTVCRSADHCRSDKATVALPPQTLARIELRLAHVVGPIASILVRRTMPKARDGHHLIELLAQEIDDLQERRSFLDDVGRLGI